MPAWRRIRQVDTSLDLPPRRRRPTPRRVLLAAQPPDLVGNALDRAINGEPPASPLHARQGHDEFRGRVQGPSFWLMTRGGEYNPFERRAEGVLLPVAGTSEVTVEMRPRSAAVAAVTGTAGVLAAYTIVAVPVGVAAGGVPGVGTVAGALLISIAAALWVVFAMAVWTGRRLARQAEVRTLEFLSTVIEGLGPGA